jgi:glycosyltransferase involved in cell wall biosynthesis
VKEKRLRIGFVATRLQGTDGVSLESLKWAQLLSESGHECFYFAGECDRPADRCRILPEADFKHAIVRRISRDLFDGHRRSPDTTDAIHEVWRTLEHALHSFVEDFALDALIVENALSMPMNVPLGLALTSLIAESSIPTIAHHHDFVWERPRYNIHAAADYLQAAFPPVMPDVHNVVINSFAATQLARRTGMQSTIIPNVMDFEHPPAASDDTGGALREVLKIAPDELLILQPTRVVPRKRIERSIELACRLQVRCCVVVTHSAGDEGNEYQTYLKDIADRLRVRILFAADQFKYQRGELRDGRAVFSLADAYQHADLVTYPSIVEGFGNAFIEAIYYRRPIVMSGYEIFKADIKPKGFQVIEFGEFTSDEVVANVRNLLHDSDRVLEMTEQNYELGRRYYSYASLRNQLRILTDQISECSR